MIPVIVPAVAGSMIVFGTVDSAGTFAAFPPVDGDFGDPPHAENRTISGSNANEKYRHIRQAFQQERDDTKHRGNQIKQPEMVGPTPA